MAFHLNGYSNFHDDNQDWIVSKIKNIEDAEAHTEELAEAAEASANRSEHQAANAATSALDSAQSALEAAQSADDSQGSADAASASEAAAKNYADHIADPVSGLVTNWLDVHVTPTTPIVDDTLTISGAAADAKKTGDEITDLKSAMGQLYDSESVVDEFGSNASVSKNWKTSFLSPSWDGATKTLSVTMTASHTSADNYYVSLAPKFINGHKYVVALNYTLQNSHYIYAMNCFSQSTLNSGDKFLWGELRANGASDAITFTATADGWLTVGVRLNANIQENWAISIAVYDVTGYDVSGIDSATWTALSDVVTISVSGLVPTIQEKAEYCYALVPTIQEKAEYSYAFESNVKGEKWTALGDSLTARGSGSQYLGYVSDRLELAEYNNCGIGGTTISGATNSNAMYQDVRINALDIDSNCITVMGGSNDYWQEYYKDHPNSNLTGWGDCTRENHDVSTFCGAYNVLVSKILYKFCLIPAYYSDVDYTGITQVSTAIDNFRLVLITPPQAFYVEGGPASATLLQNGITAAHSYVKQIAELWGLPCVDSWEMGMNDINKPLFFANYLTDATHFNAFGHERLASLIIDKALQISRYK